MPWKDKKKAKEYIVAWVKRNPEKMAKYARQHTGKLRRDMFMYAGGAFCKRCGFSDVRALQIDHIEAYGNKNRLNRSLLRRHIKENPSKYQVLCANCNWIKKAEKDEVRRKYAIK